MEISSNIAMSASEDIKNICEMPADLQQSTSSFIGDSSVNDLGIYLSMSLTIQDDKDSTKIKVEKEDICEDPCQTKLATSTSEKFLSKAATFPSSKVMSSSASLNGEKHGKVGNGEDVVNSELSALNGQTKSVSAPCPRSISLPIPLKLVSALKGSREKQGTPPKKLTVKWAPDVYDPPPTAVSHVVTNKYQRHRNDSKKSSKNKQKNGGKTSRMSKGKDKKQARKHGGNSNRCFKSLDDDERVIEPFNIGSPDPYCGTSFLKTSVTKLHFSVAEAT